VSTWRDAAAHWTRDCGHFIAEERPAELLNLLQRFLRPARLRD
jgi:pimeloyl-ACP methyl ester carboxylesterase